MTKCPPRPFWRPFLKELLKAVLKFCFRAINFVLLKVVELGLLGTFFAIQQYTEIFRIEQYGIREQLQEFNSKARSVYTEVLCQSIDQGCSLYHWPCFGIVHSGKSS